jgi:mannose-6-phosphate isomerase-like protein (cupin superfamily)
MPAKQKISDLAALLAQPFVHTIVGQVDDYCAYLSYFEGVYRFHSHNRDEMYMVLQGEIYIEYDDGRKINLRPQETLVVQAGEVHRSGAAHKALVLIFKARDLFAE